MEDVDEDNVAAGGNLPSEREVLQQLDVLLKALSEEEMEYVTERHAHVC